MQAILSVDSSEEKKYDGKDACLSGTHSLSVQVCRSEDDNKSHVEGAKIDSKDHNEKTSYSAFAALKYFPFYYINFHEVKKEVSTKKTSRGNLTSFLAKHLSNLIGKDQLLVSKKDDFENELKSLCDKVKEKTNLEEFVHRIRDCLKENLRADTCEIDFTLPDYEDIFLEMIFKIGINDDCAKVPLDHLGDGYISMFVMSVIEAIANSDEGGNLFIFEEPETYLHENHQEYFYNKVLCKLAKNNQVIYTTHSKRMVDIFSPESIICLSHDGKATRVKQATRDKESKLEMPKDYGKYLRQIEPNLGKLLFSDKVLIVEGPYDVMAYTDAIQNLSGDENFLTYKNIAVLACYGKTTSKDLIRICKSFDIDYFVIHDLDNPSEEGTPSEKATQTINDQIEELAGEGKYHFNKNNLEDVLSLSKKDFCTLKAKLENLSNSKNYSAEFSPDSLKDFLSLNTARKPEEPIQDDDIPF
ncbi:MAG: AAA family ATPase [Candidatus Caenarcaniphilales bacterium]|nr:AAA family ATPase [Candidatus Caenarcaniphilales bacterium]